MPIQSIRWSNDDLGFISCGLDGCVYEWKMAALGTNTRSSEHHGGIAGLQFDVVACGDHGSVLASGCILPSIHHIQGIRKWLLETVQKMKVLRSVEALMDQNKGIQIKIHRSPSDQA